MFVWDALSCANANKRWPKTAMDACNVIRDYAEAYFSSTSEAKELIAEWGIRRSEDLGRIIYALGNAGAWKTGKGKSVVDYAGLFVLDTWFSDDER